MAELIIFSGALALLLPSFLSIWLYNQTVHVQQDNWEGFLSFL